MHRARREIASNPWLPHLPTGLAHRECARTVMTPAPSLHDYHLEPVNGYRALAGGLSVRGPNHNLARVGRIDVGSTEASDSRLARFGRIDRSDRVSPYTDSHNALCPGVQAVC
jgi:hypothetical protein